MQTKKPNLFLIGVPKAGTSAIADGLKQHPEIFVPQKKEPRFFDARTFYDRKEDYPVKNISEYMLFYEDTKACECTYRLDASVFNIYNVESIQDILSFSEESKFLIILRDPLSATKSMFLQRMKYIAPHMREISEDFGVCWKTLPERRKGRGYPKGCRNKILFRYDLLYSYQNFLPQILRLLSDRRLFIAYYEDFKKDAFKVYSEIFSFLGIEPSFKPYNSIVNPSFIVRLNKFESMCYFVAKNTFKIRQKIGLSGKGLLKKITTPYHDLNTRITTTFDQEIKVFFKETYEYLQFLRKTSGND